MNDEVEEYGRLGAKFRDAKSRTVADVKSVRDNLGIADKRPAKDESFTMDQRRRSGTPRY